MKTILTLLFISISIISFSQSSDLVFHTAAKQYIDEKNAEAKRTLDDAIIKYPSDKRLRELRDKIKEEEKKEEKKENPKENKKNPNDQESKDQKGEKDKEGKEQQKKDSNENGEKKEDKDQQSKEEGQKSDKQQEVPSSLKQKLDEMNMSEEKANMILDALKNQEIQYLQQNKRKATQSKDNSKPDW